MNNTIAIAIWLLGAYLVGGIPFGFIIGKMRGVDVRTVGSRNIGATNVFRTVGRKWGLIAFACDVAKGLVPTLLAPDAIALWVGITCVVGHMLTPYMKFRGGKGVATAFGMLIGLIPGMVGVSFAIFCAVFACSHMISLGSCTASAFLAVAIWFPWLGVKGIADIPQCVLVTLIAVFIIFKHRANLKRIVSGTENRIYLFGSAKGKGTPDART